MKDFKKIPLSITWGKS